MDLSLHIKQTLALSPQMLQSMQVLRMSGEELAGHIEKCALENPMLEVQQHSGPPQGGAELLSKLQWLTSNGSHRFSAVGAAKEPAQEPAAAMEPTTLYAHLMSQLRMAKTDRDSAVLCAYLIGSLDENGYLDETVQTIAVQLGKESGEVVAALELLRSFEPAGVGAADLAECLLLQLQRIPRSGLAQNIVRKHLRDLGRERISRIAKEEHAAIAEVREACKLIRTLTPYPGRLFAGQQEASYVLPDLVLKEESGKMRLMDTDAGYPIVRISVYYTELLSKSEDSEVVEYLQKKLAQAAELVRSIEQRKTTLHNCAEEMIAIQEAFFCRREALVPMTLEDVASRVGVHKSTVSRAVRGKYIQCSHGVYALSDLFSRAIVREGAEGLSPDRARRAIRALIQKEDPAHPLSDQKLTERLAGQGIMVSRRTVAKYRDEMRLPPASGRKRME